MSQDVDQADAHIGTLAPADILSLELFRRSPHPYRRRQQQKALPGPHLPGSADASSNKLPHTSSSPTPRTISDEDGRRRRKAWQSPSESGTEADDEGYAFVKALPAPPLRSRKGLRDARGSPLLTPSQVNEDARGSSAEYFKTSEAGWRRSEPSPTDDEAKAARQKYLKRRRNELVRRTTETALLGASAILAVMGCGCWERLLQWRRELATHVLVVTGLLALYPLRLLYYSRSREPPSNRLLRQRIRIPASFDPAPILYPAILPVLVSISLYTSFDKGLVPNLMLSLAALPPQLVPYGASRVGFSDVHWLLSALPLAVAENTDLLANMLALKPYKLKLPAPEQGLHPEIVVSLFALHQALLPPLHYLTTTSLLPAELHLLSIGLINLLLFADSPQAGILRTLLWLGGLGIFVLCAQVLKWGVALARIPRWRFRRAGHSIAKRQSILQLLNGSFKRRSRSTGRNISDSDADEDDVLFNNTLTKTRSLKLNTGNILPEDSFIVDEPKTLDALHLPKRRNTLPSIPWRGNTRHARRDRSKSIAGSFLSLTPLQASMRRWLYAGYFYIIVILTVVGPIRHVISKYSLHHHEPFGWAVGYLFGNNQRLRFEVFNWDLEGWIALPPLVDRDSSPSLSTLGIAEYLRHVVIGEANTRLLLCIWCAGIVAVGLIVVLGLSSIVEVDTRRKVFHGTMVAMLLPTIYIDPSFVSLALSLVLAIFLLLDLIRASQLPPLSTPIAKFLTPYVDGRDLRGPVVISHIFLLVGCAIPLWLSLASVERTGDEPWRGWDVQDRDVSMIAGVICVGMGDAAASLIGRRYGRRKWPWAGGKSFEGSAAFAMAVTVGLVFGNAWLEVGGWGNRSHGDKSGTAILSHWVVVVAKAVVCAMGASLEEAVLTGGNDNVIVPVVLWVLVRGVGL